MLIALVRRGGPQLNLEGRYSAMYEQCYLAYFDLLGTKKLIRSGKFETVHEIYANAEKEFRRNCEHDYINRVSALFFSDTFILFANGSSPEAFAQIEHVSRLFFVRLLQNRIPVRGAIAHGAFFANREKSIYFGPALVEAHEYSEGQQWLNFVLTDSLIKNLEEFGLSMPRLNYSLFRVPYKNKNATDPQRQVGINERCLYAFKYHGLSFMEAVIRGLEPATGCSKYKNTLDKVFG